MSNEQERDSRVRDTWLEFILNNPPPTEGWVIRIQEIPKGVLDRGQKDFLLNALEEKADALLKRDWQKVMRSETTDGEKRLSAGEVYRLAIVPQEANAGVSALNRMGLQASKVRIDEKFFLEIQPESTHSFEGLRADVIQALTR